MAKEEQALGPYDDGAAFRFASSPWGCFWLGNYHGLVIRVTIRFSYPQRVPTKGELVATLYCPCGKAHELWAEFWWAEGRYQWVFFDYEQTSETYAEQVENCPACGRRLERKNLLS
jgi:hypothetical protein